DVLPRDLRPRAGLELLTAARRHVHRAVGLRGLRVEMERHRPAPLLVDGRVAAFPIEIEVALTLAVAVLGVSVPRLAVERAIRERGERPGDAPVDALVAALELRRPRRSVDAHPRNRPRHLTCSAEREVGRARAAHRGSRGEDARAVELLLRPRPLEERHDARLRVVAHRTLFPRLPRPAVLV